MEGHPKRASELKSEVLSRQLRSGGRRNRRGLLKPLILCRSNSATVHKEANSLHFVLYTLTSSPLQAEGEITNADLIRSTDMSHGFLGEE